MPFVLTPLMVLGLKVLAVVALVAAVFAWDHHRMEGARDEGRAEVRAQYEKRDAIATAAALAQAKRNADETERRLRAQKEAQDAHDKEVARARADADAARAAAGRLSSQLAAFTASHRAAAGDRAAVGNGQAAASALDLLADLFSRADLEAGVLAEFADASRAAGLQCERAYQALTVP